MTDKQSKYRLSVLFSVLGIFVLFRFIGVELFDYNWSFVHWQLQPTSYPIIWGLSALGLGAILILFSKKIGELFSSPKAVGLGMLGLLVVMIIFGFDSVVSSYGNRRIGQIVQADLIIYRWFEIGSIGLVACLYRFAQYIFESDYTAGLVAWKAFSYGCTILSMVGSALIVKHFTKDQTERFLYFLLLFFGSQTPVYFGFVGIETIVPVFVIWLSLFALKAINDNSLINIGWVWATVIIGVLMHASLAFLVPAAVFVTVLLLLKKNNIVIPIALGFGSYLLMIWLAYLWAGSTLEYKTFFLFAKGKLPHSDYGLFDFRHISDQIQLLFLVTPIIIAIKWSAVGQVKKQLTDHSMLFIWLACLGGMTWVFITDPKQSVVLELPKLAAYFAPFSIFAFLLIKKFFNQDRICKVYLPLVVTGAILVPMVFLPSYTSIAQSELIVDDYMEDFDAYYHDACVSYRDAYFVRGEYTESDRWERRMVVKSDEYMNIKGSADLAYQKDFSDAIRVLNQMCVANPYWADPRAQLASMQMKVGRFNMARPHLDTCLMLEPYNKIHHIHNYVYFRSIRNLPAAIKAIDQALELFPNNIDIRTDEMLIQFGIGHFEIADSLSNDLYNTSDTLAFPYYIQGMLAMRTRNTQKAIKNFEKFIELAPDEVEIPMLKARVDSLKAFGF